jgi:hypothetical protein
MISVWQAVSALVVHGTATGFGLDGDCSTKRKFLGPFDVGAEASVPAWTFGKQWAIAFFGRSWNTATIDGYYVGPATPDKGKPCALFVWNCPDGPDPPMKSVLKNVTWLNKVAVNTTLHNARQAVFSMLRDTAYQLPRGYARTPENLVRDLEIPISSVEEFKTAFQEIGCKVQCSIGKTITIDSYTGRTRAKKITLTISFMTFREWAEFAGNAKYYAVPHAVILAQNVIMLPAAKLASKCMFDSKAPGWQGLLERGKTPLALSHEVRAAPGGVELQSEAGRTAAANAREVTVYILDKEEMGEHGMFFYVFVKAGYAHHPEAQTYLLAPDIRIHGHVGYVPASVLKWSGGGCCPICLTYSEMQRESDGAAVRGVAGVGKARFFFRPTTFVKLSGLVV